MMEKLETLYEEAKPDVREQIMSYIRRFEYLLARQNLRPIQKYREYLEQIIEWYGNPDPFREEQKEGEEEWTS